MVKKRDHGTGGLYPIRGGKLWRGVIDGQPNQDGKRVQHYVHARTKTACKAKLDQLRRELEQHGAPVNRTVRVDQWAPYWLETILKPRVDPSTYRGHRSNLNQRIIPALGRKRVSSVRPADARALLAAARDAGTSASTIRYTHSTLNQLFDAARAEGLVQRNIMDDVARPSMPKAGLPAARGALTTEESLAVLEAALHLPHGTGSRHWFRLLTGPRQGEVLGAQVEHLDLAGGFYDLQWKLELLHFEHGCFSGAPPAVFPCGRRQARSCPELRYQIPDDYEYQPLEGGWHLTRPKGGQARTLPIIPPLREFLARYLDETADWPNPHGLIWRHEDGSVITPKQDQQEWRELLAAAGVIRADQAIPGGTEKTTHIGRHTTVTVLAAWGVDFQIIGEIVGHSTAEVTKIYRHARRDELMRAASLVGREWADVLQTLPEIGAGPV